MQSQKAKYETKKHKNDLTPKNDNLNELSSKMFEKTNAEALS